MASKSTSFWSLFLCVTQLCVRVCAKEQAERVDHRRLWRQHTQAALNNSSKQPTKSLESNNNDNDNNTNAAQTNAAAGAEPAAFRSVA